MTHVLWVGLGGFVGAVLRYLLSLWAHRLHGGDFPAGTLLVNVLGCLAIGALAAWVEGGGVPPETSLFLGVGLLGALTTFSTFGFETVELVLHGEPGMALLNVGLNVAVGLTAVVAGAAAYRWLGTA